MCNKNDKEQSRCITNLSLLEPLLMAMTRLALLHWKLLWCLDKQGPQTMHVRIIDMSFLAIIPISYHSVDHCHCSHWDSITAVQLLVPEASVWAQKSGYDKVEGCQMILRPFQDHRRHATKIDRTRTPYLTKWWSTSQQAWLLLNTLLSKRLYQATPLLWHTGKYRLVIESATC